MRMLCGRLITYLFMDTLQNLLLQPEKVTVGNLVVDSYSNKDSNIDSGIFF